jgi:hypothetical protein
MLASTHSNFDCVPLNSYVPRAIFSKLVVGTQVLKYSLILQQVDLNEGVPDLVVDPICCGDDGPASGQGAGCLPVLSENLLHLYAGDTFTPGYTRPDIGEAESSDASSGGLGNQSVPRGL